MYQITSNFTVCAHHHQQVTGYLDVVKTKVKHLLHSFYISNVLFNITISNYNYNYLQFP